MATETKTFYPGAYDTSDYAYDSIIGPTNPVGKGSSNESVYAEIYLTKGSSASTYISWPFNCRAIPENATIDSVACTVATCISSTSNTYISSKTVRLRSGITSKGSYTNIMGSSRYVYTLDCGNWTREELQNCNLYFSAKRGKSGTSVDIYISFYGAELTVTYTYQGERFMLKLGGAWHDAARVFKKVNGIWVEQEELANVVEDGVRYRNGGEYVAPVKKISFTIAGTSYQAEEGMTWGEWVASSYNTGGFTVDSSGIYQRSSDSYVQTTSYKLVASSETITSGYGYVLAW